MDIELRNIKYSQFLSRETEAFTSNLYINNVHAGIAENEGHGGPTHYYHINDKGRELIKLAEAFCLELPAKVYPASKVMGVFALDMNLEHYIDDLLESHLQKKEQAKFDKKLNKTMEKAIMYGIPGESFQGIGYKSTITELLATEKGVELIKNTIAKDILKNLKDGNIVLNTNIPEVILKDAGLKRDQYVHNVNAQPAFLNSEDENKTSTGRKR